jgi:hypothetical protein
MMAASGNNPRILTKKIKIKTKIFKDLYKINLNPVLKYANKIAVRKGNSGIIFSFSVNWPLFMTKI